MQNIEQVCPPSWRRAINAAENVPLLELKTHIRAEAEALPEILRADGDGEAEREALCSLSRKCSRLLQAMHLGPFKVSVGKPHKLRKRLATEAARLPDMLDRGSELKRAKQVYLVEVLCHRVLGLLLAIMLLGACPVCEFLMQMPVEDPIEIASWENPLAG